VGSDVRVFCIRPRHFLHCGITADRKKDPSIRAGQAQSRDLRAIIIYAAFRVSGFSVCFLAGQQAFSQITRSDIVGTVSDATGAFVMKAKVAVTMTATDDTRKQLSGSDGGFVFNPMLPPI
jgi:hypothetical protein